MAATPDFGGASYDDSDPLTGSAEGLGLVDFSVFPHLERDDMPDTTMAIVERWAAGLSVPPTRSTTRPPSRSSTARLRWSPRAAGGFSHRELDEGGPARLTHAKVLEIERPCEVLEEELAASEDDRGDDDVELVHDAGIKPLADHVAAAADCSRPSHRRSPWRD